MRRFNLIGFGLWLVLCVVGSVRADTFQLLDGSNVDGALVLPATPDFINVRVTEGKYQKVYWTNMSQTTLQDLVKNPKLTQFAEPYIEITIEERLKKTEPPKIIEPEGTPDLPADAKTFPHLNRPPKSSFFSALAGSSVIWMTLLLLYAANIYAGYEVAVIRAYPPAMVCSIAALAPVAGPIIFLCMPTKLKSQQEEVLEELPAEGAHVEGAVVEPTPEEAAAQAAAAEAAAAAGPALPQTQVFKRGQFTFNRRFIETKFSGFFGIARRESEKDMVLLIKSARGEYPTTRISRIAANDMHVEVRKGGATAEVQIPFVEITEIHLKHQDA